jgi:site-specific DNA recombinase
VTQPLDTGSPEGRLNLHPLTSFAQFERELIGERTREKLTATRANGLWQGNGAPLGYLVDHQQRLAVVDAEAGMVRDIFRRFLDLGSMGDLVEFLQQRGYKTKHWVTREGKKRGGQLFDRNAVYRLLNNRMLISEVYYDGQWHRGQHTPIVDVELWDRVHEVMAQRARRKGVPTKGRDPLDFPLAGRLFWHDGRADHGHRRAPNRRGAACSPQADRATAGCHAFVDRGSTG